MTKKRCSKCDELKLVGEFSKRKASKDGLQPQCKACRAAYDKRYRDANHELVTAQHKRYREAHRAEIAAYDERYYEANREEEAAYDKRYRETHREEKAASNKRYYEANREEKVAYQKRYYEANREKTAADHKRWNEANPEKCAAHKQQRRARLANVISEDFDITDLFKRDGEECRYCEATENLTIEHVKPISEGGPNTLDNCVVACRSCNSSKGAKLLVGWLAGIERLDLLKQGGLL